MNLFGLVFLCFCALSTSVEGSKILVLVPVNGKSHAAYMKVFIEELLNRKHEVTCVTCISMIDSDFKLDNYTEIVIDTPFDLRKGISAEFLEGKLSESPFRSAAMYPFFGNLASSHSIRNKNVQELIHSRDLHFDLVIIEDLYHDVFLGFGHKFNASIISISPNGVTDFFDNDMGLLTPLSHVSHLVLSNTDQMDFFQRWHNTVLTSYDWILRRFVYVPMQNKLLQENFGHLENLPTFDELRKKISIIFVNAHRSVTHPRPSMPGLIYIGGAHIKKPKPLPADLQQFLDESEHGVIYFSMGTFINASKMPKEKINAFMDTFRRLKQRVIWKFEGKSIPNLPENVLIREWLPQNDILAHPNVVLFISHGGMFSNFEAVNYGIQMLMIPFGGDQFRNAQRVQNAGYGKFMVFKELTYQTLYEVLNEMLNNKKYSNRAKEISANFRDNAVHPMDEFIWWVEHVIKFRGAKYLKSHAAEMSLFTYLLLDVIFVNLVAIVALIFGFYCIMKRLGLRKPKDNTADKKNQ